MQVVTFFRIGILKMIELYSPDDIKAKQSAATKSVELLSRLQIGVARVERSEPSVCREDILQRLTPLNPSPPDRVIIRYYGYRRTSREAVPRTDASNRSFAADGSPTNLRSVPFAKT